MNKTAKALLIPVAAFAVTVTGAQAFNSEVLERAGLSETQIAAFEQARELRAEGDREGARNALVDVGLDLETMQAVREAMHEHRDEMHAAIDAAVDAEDYEAFLEAIDGSPLAEVITSEDDFEQFVIAHNLRTDGSFDEAREIMEALGMPVGPKFDAGYGFRKENKESRGDFRGMHDGTGGLYKGQMNGSRGNQ